MADKLDDKLVKLQGQHAVTAKALADWRAVMAPGYDVARRDKEHRALWEAFQDELRALDELYRACTQGSAEGLATGFKFK